MKPLRVLIVEDSAADAELELHELRRHDFDPVFKRVDTAEAMAAALDDPSWDIVLADYVMPQFSAPDALALLKERRPDLPCILVSGSIGEDLAVAAIRQGATDYLLKDRLERLGHAVTQALEQKRLRGQQRAAETALRDSEERFRLLFREMTSGFALHEIICDASGQPVDYRFLEVNPAFERMTGLTREQVVGKTAREVLPEIRPDLITLYGEVALTQRQVCFESRVEALGKHFECAVYGLQRGQFAVLQNDVTERIRSERDVREQATLLDQIHDAVIVQDSNGQIRHWGKGAERLYGFSAAEAIGQMAMELLPRQVAVGFSEVLRALASTGEWNGEMRSKTKSGAEVTVQSRWVQMHELYQGRTSILVVDTDVTDQRRVERQFLRAQRMESVGRLAGGLAHDLNNVLAPIIMGAPLLRDGVTSKSALNLLDAIEASAQRGVGIIRQVLMFARGVEAQKGPVVIDVLLREIGRIIRETFPKSISLESAVTPALWVVNADATQLHQVLLNLCVNARDAMPKGGKLTLGADNIWLDEDFARQTPGAKSGPHVILTVTDTGTGIPPGDLEKIFDPFFTTKSPEQGTGLGLASVMGIVKNHEGFLQVTSKVGQGTQFKVYLPATADSAQEPVDAALHDAPHGQGELILVADDEDAVRFVLRKVLERGGYQVLDATDGIETVTAFMQRRAEIKLAIVDMVMPFMDGLSAIRRIRALEPKAKIIAVSGRDPHNVQQAVSELGVDGCLLKPFSISALLREVHDVLISPSKSVPSLSLASLEAAPKTPPVEGQPPTPADAGIVPVPTGQT